MGLFCLFVLIILVVWTGLVMAGLVRSLHWTSSVRRQPKWRRHSFTSQYNSLGISRRTRRTALHNNTPKLGGLSLLQCRGVELEKLCGRAIQQAEKGAERLLSTNSHALQVMPGRVMSMGENRLKKLVSRLRGTVGQVVSGKTLAKRALRRSRRRARSISKARLWAERVARTQRMIWNSQVKAFEQAENQLRADALVARWTKGAVNWDRSSVRPNQQRINQRANLVLLKDIEEPIDYRQRLINNGEIIPSSSNDEAFEQLVDCCERGRLINAGYIKPVVKISSMQGTSFAEAA